MARICLVRSFYQAQEGKLMIKTVGLCGHNNKVGFWFDDKRLKSRPGLVGNKSEFIDCMGGCCIRILPLTLTGEFRFQFVK